MIVNQLELTEGQHRVYLSLKEDDFASAKRYIQSLFAYSDNARYAHPERWGIPTNVARKVIQMRKTGKTLKEISKKLNISTSSVWRICQDPSHFGVGSDAVTELPGPGAFSPYKKNRILSLHKDGLSNLEIAREMKLNRSTVQRFLKSQGVRANSNRLSQAEKDLIISLSRDGKLSLRRIARIVGCCKLTVERVNKAAQEQETTL